MKFTPVEVSMKLTPFERGRQDCYQDRCENIPFSSIGGLKCRSKMIPPRYLEFEDVEEYLRGYRDAAKALFGEDWETCEFGWVPTLTINASMKDWE
jgi:hypothetical protein